MAKKSKRRLPRREKIETLVMPSAANAKWIGIGFLTSAVAVGIAIFMMIQAHTH